MIRAALILALLAVRAFAACSAGFIQITDPFLNPDGSAWTGAITYTLAYNTTVAGATVVSARQNINVNSGLSLCLAPGLYTPVTLQQSGQRFAVTQAWGVPAFGGPYTVGQISSNVTLTSPVQSAKVTLQPADIQALGSTPITLVPAPGAGNYLAISLVVTQQNGTPNWTGGIASFFIGTVLLEDENIFFNSGNPSFYFQFAPVVVTGSGAALVNQPFTISATGAITGSGGTMTIVTYYTVVAIP